MREKKYASDISREKFAELEPLLCSVRRCTKPTTVDRYEVFCAVLYVLRTGCQWRFLPSEFHEMLFDAHTKSFSALGGVTRRGIYDNMKTAVDKVKKGKGRIVNARFAAMCSHYLFNPDFCNVASGWEKGVVEKNVQDSRRRIWIEAGTRRLLHCNHPDTLAPEFV